MKYTLPQLQELFKDYLASLRYEQEPKGLYDPINYELDLGGKRLRPLLLLPKIRSPFSRTILVLIGASSSVTPRIDMVPSGLM